VHKLIILAIIVAAVGWAEAATYYVDSDDGRDDPSQSGGPLEPWRTITYALSCVSGENTFMCRGTFNEQVKVGNDDYKSTFIANSDAVLKGYIRMRPYVGNLRLDGLRVYGYTGIGANGNLVIEDCYFNNPGGPAVTADGCGTSARVYRCVIENCSEATATHIELGTLSFRDCVVKNCGKGISGDLSADLSVYNSRFEVIDRTAVSAEGVVEGCEFYNNGLGAEAWVPDDAVWSNVRASIFINNGTGISASYWRENYGGVIIDNNLVIMNQVYGIKTAGPRIYLNGNVVKDNYGHGVYIENGAPDLGTPAEPGSNTFAGNKSGYDVYNASSENIPAYGNTWDPQSEAEMKGKTWQEVNVTRIYDHWDDPDVGYVMWSEPMLGVAPASLGRIKASFRDGSPSALRRPAKGTDAAK
jgi:hypothetical protein